MTNERQISALIVKRQRFLSLALAWRVILAILISILFMMVFFSSHASSL